MAVRCSTIVRLLSAKLYRICQPTESVSMHDVRVTSMFHEKGPLAHDGGSPRSISTPGVDSGKLMECSRSAIQTNNLHVM